MGTRLIVTENNPLVVVRASGAPGRTIISGEGLYQLIFQKQIEF